MLVHVHGGRWGGREGKELHGHLNPAGYFPV